MKQKLLIGSALGLALILSGALVVFAMADALEIGHTTFVQAIVITINTLFIVALLGTIGIGIAVTAVAPPLRPVSEISVLGQRVTSLAKFALATGALFSTAYVTWMVAKTYDSYVSGQRTSSDPTRELATLLGQVLLTALFIYFVWLSVDLLRLGRERRYAAIDVLVQRMDARDWFATEFFGVVARLAMRNWWWILSGFYVGPTYLAAAGVLTFLVPGK